MDVELRQLRALVAVVDAGTFTDAAIDLGVSQASVSRAVAALEEALGVRVLRRTTRTVAATAAGVAVVRRARRVLAEVEALHRAVDETGASIRLGYAWSALGAHTAGIQRRWAAAHPGGRIDLVPADTPTGGLLEGVADVSVVRRAVDGPRFATRLVGTERRMVAVAADDPWARRRFVRLAEFAGLVVAVNSRTGTTGESLWAAGAAPAELRETEGVERWLNVIAAGEAVGITPEATAHQHPREGVVYRPVRDADPVPVHLAWWRDDPPAGLDALVALVVEAYHPADARYRRRVARDDLQETRAFVFGPRAAGWDARFGDDMPAYEAAVAETGIPPGGATADVGCGTGRALPALRQAIGDAGVLLGFDVTPEMLDAATDRARAARAGLVLADAMRLPLKASALDVVFAAGLVSHLPDPADGLRELARVTRPGGRLALFHPVGRAALAARRGRTLRPDEPLAPGRLPTLLRETGWRLLSYEDAEHRFWRSPSTSGVTGPA